MENNIEDPQQPSSQLVKVTVIKQLPFDYSIVFSMGSVHFSSNDVMKILHHWIYKVYLVETLELPNFLGIPIGNQLIPNQRIIAIKISNKELTDDDIFQAAIKMTFKDNIDSILGSIINKRLLNFLTS